MTEEEKIREAFEEGWYCGSSYGYGEARSGQLKGAEEALTEDWQGFLRGERT